MNELTIRGLSLTRPWPFAFVNGPPEEQKRIENRSWKPYPNLIGHYIALHAAKSWDEGDREYIANAMGLYVPTKPESPHSQIFAVCKLGGYIETTQDQRLIKPQRKWFFGPYGWLFDEFVQLKTVVACTGAQGLWSFDKKQDELHRLRESYREALASPVVA